MSLTNYDWDFSRLEELIQARGDDVIHETGVACTCRNDDVYATAVTPEGNPASIRKMNCTICQGDGFIYRNARVIKGLITSIQAGSNRRLLEPGFAVPGDCVFSPSLAVGMIGDFDRITFTFPTVVSEGQVIMRGAATIDENAILNTGLAETEDRLWYLAAESVWCEDRDGHVYTQGADFVLENKLIRWTGASPTVGTLYSLKYTAYLEWVVYATPLARFDRARSLAQRVLLRKKHVAYFNGSSATSPSERQTEQLGFSTITKI